MPKVSRYPPPPEGARYRCGFPGCSKRYASTDGVRKHARKAHNNWLHQVDAHSGMRDKSSENKPSTYCIMECGEPEQPGGNHAGVEGYMPRVEVPPLRRADEGLPVPLVPQMWQMPGGGLLDHSAFEMGRSLTLLNALTANCGVQLNPLAGMAPPFVPPFAPIAPNFPSLAAFPSVVGSPPLADVSDASSVASARDDEDLSTPAAGPVGPTSYETPGREGKAGGELSPPPFELEPVAGGCKAPLGKPSVCDASAGANESDVFCPQMTDEAFFKALLAL